MNSVNFTLPQLDVSTLPGPDTILRYELANGIIVLARENFSSPSVVISGFLYVGSLDTSHEKAGLAQLTANALMRGTQTRSFQDIFEAIESIGAALGYGAGTHTTSFYGKALVEDLDLLLELLVDSLSNPIFPKEQVERLKAEHLTALAFRDQDTGARSQLAFDEIAYPDHPYNIPSSGFQETVSGLEVNDLQDFHRQHYGPKEMVVAAVGAIDAQAALDAIESRIGGWSVPKKHSRPDLPAVARPKRIIRREVPLSGKSQCDVVLGVPGPSRFEDDYLAAAMGNNILGRFGLQGRIGGAVRDTAGLAYYAYSSLIGGPGPGPWQVNAGVNPANVEKAIELIRSEIRRFVTKRVNEDELTDNQANFIGRLPLQLESNEGVANALLHIERYGLGLDYYQRYPDLIAAITREKLLQMARQYLDHDRLAIAIAGPVEGGK